MIPVYTDGDRFIQVAAQFKNSFNFQPIFMQFEKKKKIHAYT